MQYQENGLLQWQYLAELFPDEFPNAEPIAASYKSLKTMNLAYQFNRFHVANKLSENRHEFGNYKISFFFRIKQIAAKTKLSFRLFRSLKIIKMRIK
jgi:hypothetical protein